MIKNKKVKNMSLKVQKNKQELRTQNDNFDCKMYNKFSMIQIDFMSDMSPIYSL